MNREALAGQLVDAVQRLTVSEEVVDGVRRRVAINRESGLHQDLSGTATPVNCLPTFARGPKTVTSAGKVTFGVGRYLPGVRGSLE